MLSEDVQAPSPWRAKRPLRHFFVSCHSEISLLIFTHGFALEHLIIKMIVMNIITFCSLIHEFTFVNVQHENNLCGHLALPLWPSETGWDYFL